jgi:glutathione S-transferase
MKLYGHPLSPCTRKVKMTLAEKSAEAEFFLVDLFKGEHRSGAHLARQPFGVIPALEDDGFVLFESRAIIRYLDTRLGGPSLVPSTPWEAGRMAQWLSVDQSYVAPHTRTLAIERVAKSHEGTASDDEAVRGAEASLRRALDVIEGALETSAYLAGPTFSLADVSLAPYVASLPSLGVGAFLEERPRLAAWWRRVSERPSWSRAIG